MNCEKVMDKVQEHYDRLVAEGYEVVGVYFLGRAAILSLDTYETIYFEREEKNAKTN